MSLGSDDAPIVLIESPFVVERKDDGVDKMVYVCLTTESLLIGEENIKGNRVCGEGHLDSCSTASDDIKTACRCRDDREDGDWDLQDFRLRYLFPLQHVRLSIRQYREKEGMGRGLLAIHKGRYS